VCCDFGEDSTHLFFMCNKSIICWQRSGLWSLLMAVFDIDASFPTNVFAILQHLDQQQKKVFSVTLWSIWKHRNNKVWNNVTETAQAICARAGFLITSWKNAQTIRHHIPQHPATPNDLKWIKPSPRIFKCNVDAAFSQARKRVGIGVCIRDDEGRYVLAKTEWMTPLLDVDLGEALGLLSAMYWVRDLQLGIVDFELDSKTVVDSLYDSKSGVSNFSAVINDCRRLL